MGNKIKGISFDIWDTLLVDDSDEVKRKSKGLLSKVDARIKAVYDVAKLYNKSYDEVRIAFKENLTEFNQIWHKEFRTLTVPVRLNRLFDLLNVKPISKDFNQVVQVWENMEYEVAPDPVPNINTTLEILSKDYKLAIASDAIVSPGHVLRKILDKYNLLKYFQVFSFSDEIGFSKPHHKMFEYIVDEFYLLPNEIVHIGDRPHNDIDGPKKFMMKAFLYDGIKKRDLAKYEPDAVFSDYSKLPELLEKFNSE